MLKFRYFDFDRTTFESGSINLISGEWKFEQSVEHSDTSTTYTGITNNCSPIIFNDETPLGDVLLFDEKGVPSNSSGTFTDWSEP